MEKEKVAQYINRKQLLQPTDKVLVALSGGADSVALLRLLQASGYDCEAAHCNFHLRGAESDRDEAFVRQLCVKQQVPLHTVHFDTARTAEERHISIEMAARELRYGWFEEIRQKINADAIAVAHHQDDSVETLLLNLIRGTGINGLRGIRPKNGHIVRPLLCLERKRNHQLSEPHKAGLRNGQHQSAGRIYPQQNTLEPASHDAGDKPLRQGKHPQNGRASGRCGLYI